jgi:hypothetical protein
MSEVRIPEVRLGDTVFWYDGGSKSSEPRVAFVTAVGFLGTISVAIIEVNAIMLNVRDGVRHVDDPSVRDAELQYSGGWEHREAYFKRQAEERQRREKKAVAAN